MLCTGIFFSGLLKWSSTYDTTSGPLVPLLPFPVIYIQMTFLSGCLHHSPSIIYIIQLELEEYKLKKTFKNTNTDLNMMPTLHESVLKHSLFLENKGVCNNFILAKMQQIEMQSKPRSDSASKTSADVKRRGNIFQGSWNCHKGRKSSLLFP